MIAAPRHLKPGTVLRFHGAAECVTVDALGFSAILFTDGSSLSYADRAWNHAEVQAEPRNDLPAVAGGFRRIDASPFYDIGDAYVTPEQLLAIGKDIVHKLGYLVQPTALHLVNKAEDGL